MGKTMNRAELVTAVAKTSGQSQVVVAAVITGLFETVAEEVGRGTKITIPGWVGIQRTDRVAREGRNPRTGEPVSIPATHAVKLAPGSKLKNAVKPGR